MLAFAGPTANFRNWAGNVRGHPREILYPETREQLQEFVKRSRKVRLLGSGHSFNDAALTDNTLIATDKLDRVLEIDRERRQVKVEAGMKLRDLNKILWQQGLAFPSLGDIAEQSLAGLVSTGTHGTGLAWGSFSDGRSLLAIELVLADGSLLELRHDRPEDAEQLAAARLSLGALGVIYAITFQVDEAHHLRLDSRIMSLAEAQEERWYRDTDHFEYFTFPFTDKVMAVSRQRTDAVPHFHNWWARFYDAAIENMGLKLLMDAASLMPSQVDKVMRLMTKLATAESYVGRSYEVMASMRRVRFYEMEYAFPLSCYPQVLDVYNDVNDFYARRQTEHARYYASFPGEVRFLGGDQGTMLSPTRGRDTAYLAVQVYPSFGSGYVPYFETMEQELRALDGRPHWGKLFYQNPADRYPEFERFATIRKQLDPMDKFVNAYLKRILD